MNTRKPSHWVIWSALLCALMACTWGCGTSPFGTGIESTFTPPAPAELPEAKPARAEPKPVDAEDDPEDRHPHRWRKKLRAKYT